jgi:RimJ/RimL family protein N-acetyltransferase
MLTIRPLTPDDAAAFLALCLQLDAETPFMLLEPGERRTTVAEQRSQIVQMAAAGSITFVAERDDQLVGYVAAERGMYRRNRHSAYVVVGILHAFTGQGIGARLFAAVDQWARAENVHRLELTVMIHNHRAVRLYEKMGFRVEGIRQHAIRKNNVYVDEYAMAKCFVP